MSALRPSKFGVFGTKTRLLQRSISFERTTLSGRTVRIYKYLGDATNDYPSLTDRGDPILMEITDRAYDSNYIEVNVHYDPIEESVVDMTQFGVLNPLGDTHRFYFHSESFESDGMGRYPVVGDVIEMANDEMTVYFEITDVDRKKETDIYTIVCHGKLITDGQEVQQIPNKESNESFMEDIRQSLKTEVESVFDQEGLDTSDIQLDDETPQTPYDSRPDHTQDFLDNPDIPIK